MVPHQKHKKGCKSKMTVGKLPLFDPVKEKNLKKI